MTFVVASTRPKSSNPAAVGYAAVGESWLVIVRIAVSGGRHDDAE
ncbi:hypothetical protein [Lentzea flaviverrucosa]|nr:hypothetical protein [Lentzea flaviverrucosa]